MVVNSCPKTGVKTRGIVGNVGLRLLDGSSQCFGVIEGNSTRVFMFRLPSCWNTVNIKQTTIIWLLRTPPPSTNNGPSPRWHDLTIYIILGYLKFSDFYFLFQSKVHSHIDIGNNPKGRGHHAWAPNVNKAFPLFTSVYAIHTNCDTGGYFISKLLQYLHSRQLNKPCGSPLSIWNMST